MGVWKSIFLAFTLRIKTNFLDTNTDFLRELGKPSEYIEIKADFEKFQSVLMDAHRSLNLKMNSAVLDLAMIYLAIRNIGICYSLHIKQPNFSRNAPFKLPTLSLQLDDETINMLESCRMISSRGIGKIPSTIEIEKVKHKLDDIIFWTSLISKEIK